MFYPRVIQWCCEIEHMFWIKFSTSEVAGGIILPQRAKTLGSTSIRYPSDTFASDRCLFDVDPRVFHYNDVVMGTIASQMTSLTIVYSTVYSDADQRKHQSSASLAFVRGIHRGPVNSPHKWPVTGKHLMTSSCAICDSIWYATGTCTIIMKLCYFPLKHHWISP